MLVRALAVAIICLASTSTASAQRGLAHDCQRDFGCFAAASANCGPARVELHVAIPLPGTELDSTQSYEVLGSEGEYCLFRSRVERIAPRIDSGRVSPEQLVQQRGVIAAILSGIAFLDVT